jgi:hypothetical protein
MAVEPPKPASFRLGQAILWLVGSMVLGVLVAWAAEVAEAYSSPFLLFPLLVGVILGAVIVAALRLCRVGHRPTIVLGGLLAIAVTVAGQHYLSFWKYRQTFQGDTPAAARLRRAQPLFDLPTTWPEYLRSEAHRGWNIGSYTFRDEMAWLMWGLDALLVAAPAVVLIITAARLPFCDRCRSWYHTMRSGRIDPETTCELAAAAGLSAPAEFFSGRYRLSGCAAGCSPAALELFWDEPDRDFSSDRLWLDRAHRDQILDILERRAERIAAADRDRQPKRRRKKPHSDEPKKEDNPG